MARIVHCVKLGRDLPGLEEAPWPGEIGQRIYEQVSAQAWGMWKDHAKMLLNEFRMAPWTPEAQKMIREQMEGFFFGTAPAPPPGYVPPGSGDHTQR